MNRKERAREILQRLQRRYPDASGQLSWKNPWELLVATVLAAQCTDRRVNMVTPELFRRWPTPQALARAEQSEVEEVIRSTGFFRNKAKNLIAAARTVERDFDGEVPSGMQELLTLPGVARKTANIVLSHGFGVQEGIAVDTHVRRLAYRMGLTQSKNPSTIEKDLQGLFDRESWGRINHLLVWFGREVCRARGPLCRRCELADICPRVGVDSPGSGGSRSSSAMVKGG